MRGSYCRYALRAWHACPCHCRSIHPRAVICRREGASSARAPACRQRAPLAQNRVRKACTCPLREPGSAAAAAGQVPLRATASPPRPWMRRRAASGRRASRRGSACASPATSIATSAKHDATIRLPGIDGRLRRFELAVTDVRLGRTARSGATQGGLARSSAGAFMPASVSGAASRVCVPAHVDHGRSRTSRTLSLHGGPLQRTARDHGSTGSRVETLALADKLCQLWSPQQIAG